MTTTDKVAMVRRNAWYEGPHGRSMSGGLLTTLTDESLTRLVAWCDESSSSTYRAGVYTPERVVTARS